MIPYIEYLGVPTVIALIIIAALLIANVIGELLELKGKVVPEFIKMRKFFTRRSRERKENADTLREVKSLLADVNAHYSEDNITKRNSWMQWVNNRADVYDNSITSINNTLANVTEALKDNTKLTEEMFVQQSRDRIIDFARHVADEKAMVSREEFNRIFKVYERYESFLDERGLTNGEVEIAHQIINDSYKCRMESHSFLEDARGY